MFLLKTRHSYNDRGGNDAGNQPGVSVQITLPGPLDAATYAKLGANSRAFQLAFQRWRIVSAKPAMVVRPSEWKGLNRDGIGPPEQRVSARIGRMIC